MKSIIKFVPFAIAAALMTDAAQAADGTINFGGKLSAQTCTITVDGVVTPAAATVTLPTVSAGLLDAPGKVTGRTSFEIELSNCSSGGTQQYAQGFFEAGSDVDPISGQLINRGTATNVRLQLVDNDTGIGTIIKAGDPSQLLYTSGQAIISGNSVLAFAVEYYATGTASIGTVTSAVTYSINYY